MAQYPSNIDLSSLNGSTGFKLSGENANDNFGSTVASAGDINGDGFADLVVGAIYANYDGHTQAGSAYIVFGRASGFASNLNMSTLDGTNGVKLVDLGTLDHFGASVASAGDVNGDGFADVIVSAPGANPTYSDAGASYVLFGKSGGFLNPVGATALNGINGFAIQGASPEEYAGWSVSSAGDVNGDGIADIIIGAKGSSPNSTTDAGATYVVFGTTSGFPNVINVSMLDGGNGFRISGAAAYDFSGWSVSSAGDVNGDGFADLLIGAQSADPHGNNSGAAFVVFGKGSGFSSNIDLSSLNGTNGFKLSGGAAFDYTGDSVAAAGDINGDGYADIIIGAPSANPNGNSSGASYVVFGKASGFAANLDLSTLNGNDGFKIAGVGSGDMSGWSVASAGDVNGDGFDDVFVGAPAAFTSTTLAGVGYVIFGKASGFSSVFQLSSINGSNGFTLSGDQAFDNAGHSVASAGDVNGDGITDLIIGAPGASPNGSTSGASYVVFGRLPDTAVNRTGTVASQSLVGGNLNDVLSGLAGNDKLYGNGGSDTLNGGPGRDTLIGGTGSDKFIFDSSALTDAQAPTPVFDKIADYDKGGGAVFNTSEGDQIDLSAIVQSAFTGGQAANALVRVVDDPSNTHVLLQVDPDGTANGAQWTTLAQLNGLHGSDSVNAILSSAQPGGTSFSVLSNDGHFGDFDKDGKADLVWRNDDGTVATWQMNGSAAPVGNFLPGVSSDWHIMGTGDFNGDGHADIVWLNDDGSMIYWRMNSSSVLGATVNLPNAPDDSYLAGIGDVDHDTRSDLIWRDLTTGAVTIQTAGNTSNTISGVGNDWSVVGVGDYNGDGKADVMFRNESLGINAAWLMNGTAVASTVFYPGVPNDWHVVGTGDFNGDGTADLLWHNDNGANAVWLMNTAGGILQSAFFDGVSSDWHVVGTGDFNGDHKDDVLWRNDNGATAVWLMNGAATPTVSFPGGVPDAWATQAHHYDFV